MNDTHDALNRRTKTIRDLRQGGTVTGSVTTQARFDRNSRLVASLDDKGNTTGFRHDALDRQVEMIYPDGKKMAYKFDRDDNVVQTTDPNGTVVYLTYDTLDRLTGKAIARGAGVLGTTAEGFTYDGLSRLLSAQDDDSTV